MNPLNLDKVTGLINLISAADNAGAYDSETMKYRLKKLNEELAELSVELHHYFNKPNGADTSKIENELADVLLRLMLVINNLDVDCITDKVIQKITKNERTSTT